MHERLGTAHNEATRGQVPPHTDDCDTPPVVHRLEGMLQVAPRDVANDLLEQQVVTWMFSRSAARFFLLRKGPVLSDRLVLAESAEIIYGTKECRGRGVATVCQMRQQSPRDHRHRHVLDGPLVAHDGSGSGCYQRTGDSAR